jgi:hypothetical protein
MKVLHREQQPERVDRVGAEQKWRRREQLEEFRHRVPFPVRRTPERRSIEIVGDVDVPVGQVLTTQL